MYEYTDSWATANEWASANELASWLGLSPRTIKSWRSKKIGPRYIRISKTSVIYNKKDVRDWLSTRRVDTQPRIAQL